MNPYKIYEERPARCQAVPVWHDTISQIADYYSTNGYESDLYRGDGKTVLTISHPGYKDGIAMSAVEGFEITMELVHNYNENADPTPRQVLVYGRPPRLEDANEFERRWKDIEAK